MFDRLTANPILLSGKQQKLAKVRQAAKFVSTVKTRSQAVARIADRSWLGADYLVT